MNRSFASWLVDNPGVAVIVTGLLGLLPLFGLGFAFFLPGAVPGLVTLVRGPRAGVVVAIGATALLTLAMWLIGRPVPVGLIYATWVLGPPLALGVLLGRTGSLSLCLQVAVLAGIALLVFLHASLGEPEKFWAPFVRDLAQEMQRRCLPMDLEKDGLVETLARTLWGWVTALTMLLAMCALFLARWWQSLAEHAGRVGAGFQQLLAHAPSLGRAICVYPTGQIPAIEEGHEAVVVRGQCAAENREEDQGEVVHGAILPEERSGESHFPSCPRSVREAIRLCPYCALRMQEKIRKHFSCGRNRAEQSSGIVGADDAHSSLKSEQDRIYPALSVMLNKVLEP